MIKKFYRIPKIGGKGLQFIKVGYLQGKKKKGEIAQYKQIDGHLHVIEYPDYYELHNDKYQSINGPIAYIKHGLLELFPMWLFDIFKRHTKIGKKIAKCLEKE